MLKFVRLLVEPNLTLVEAVTTASQLLITQRCHYFPKEILTTAFERIIFFILLEADVEGDIVYCMNSKGFFS